MDKAQWLRELADDYELLEVGRKAIEDQLIEMRDSRMFIIRQGAGNNGFVVRERDGKPSEVIRFGPEVGLQIAFRAMAEHLSKW